MEDSCLVPILMLVCVAVFVIGIFFGIDSMWVFVPLAVILGIVAWYYMKDPEGKRKWSAMPLTTIVVIVITFILVSLGSCVRSCTGGGGDLRQQRIETTGHAY